MKNIWVIVLVNCNALRLLWQYQEKLYINLCLLVLWLHFCWFCSTYCMLLYSQFNNEINYDWGSACKILSDSETSRHGLVLKNKIWFNNTQTIRTVRDLMHFKTDPECTLLIIWELTCLVSFKVFCKQL